MRYKKEMVLSSSTGDLYEVQYTTQTAHKNKIKILAKKLLTLLSQAFIKYHSDIFFIIYCSAGL